MIVEAAASESPSLASPTPVHAFRPDIQVLRGIAILSVVAFHCGVPFFAGGFIGVDVFFVLSGYLITALLLRELESTSRIRLIEFYARRVRRLLPASSLTVLCSLAIAALLMAPSELSSASRAARAATLYASNLFFALNAGDYFAPDVRTNPLLHMWSLAVEEQFYFVWPAFLFIAWRLVSRRGIAPLLAAIAALSFAFCIFYTWRTQTGAFYSLPARAWEFAIGGLAAIAPGPLEKLPRKFRLLAGTAIVLTSICFISEHNFPGWKAAAPVLGTILILSAGENQSTAWRPLLTLGDLSYSWYLWHWPFLVLAAVMLPNLGLTGRIAAALLALALAAITHYTVENPVRFHPKLARNPRRTIVLGLLLMAVCLVASWATLRFANHLAQQPAFVTISKSIDDIADMQRAQCVNTAINREVKTCTFATVTAPVHIVLFGDSHAIQWFNALQDAAKENNWRLTTVLKSGCPAFDFPVRSKSSLFDNTCREWRHNAIAAIKQLHPSLVLIGNSSKYLEEGTTVAEWQKGIRETISALGENRIAAIRDTPNAPFDVPTCLARSARHSWYPGGNCSFPLAEQNTAAFNAELHATTPKNLTFIDLTNAFCADGNCWAKRDGVITYRDDNHITGAYSRLLSHALAAKLSAALP